MDVRKSLWNKLNEYAFDMFSNDLITEEESESILDKGEIMDVYELLSYCEELGINVHDEKENI